MNLGRVVLKTWAELAWAEFYVGRVGMCRVGFGPSCPSFLSHSSINISMVNSLTSQPFR